ncbi:hypothetical protein AMS68_004549 [Peltaster fructicola]|uniref:Hydrophobic surface binding protein A n=1 Tax=Peltaster fructicola TaxID=286661 RepID=A0A6H0XW88_9PEZI|nr:hypothetical protein AMS68_004549 [Peltaster fructicola]
MLFKSLAALSVLAATVAADGASIQAALAAVDKQALTLDSSVKQFDGSSAVAAFPVLINTLQLQSTIQSGTATAKNSSALSNDEAIALVAPVQQLAKDTNTTLTDIINKYQDFNKNNLAAIVKSNLQSSKQDSDDFSAAIIAKVPQALQSTAQSIAAPIDQAFANAIAVYSQGSSSSFGF